MSCDAGAHALGRRPGCGPGHAFPDVAPSMAGGVFFPRLMMRLLDLFCGAGGCAAGYSRAGFTEIVGVDIEPQPRYPFEFRQNGALDFLRGVRVGDFALIHASPPCQHYSRATAWRGDRSTHPDLIAAVRSALAETGIPYVIENVEDARHRLREPLVLCGTALGLPLRRHRYFETSVPLLGLRAPCQHRPEDYSHDHGLKQTESVYREAMGCGWMTVHEARQAVPPAYTEWLGRQLIGALS